jgi:hypothetical protein
MDNSSFAGNRQTLLLGAAVTGLTLAVAFSIQPLLPLSDSRGGTAEVDPLLELDEPAFADQTGDGTDASDAPEFVIEETAALDEAPVAISDAAAEVPERFVRHRDHPVEEPAATEDSTAVMPPPYQQRLSLLNAERETLLRKMGRDDAIVLESPPVDSPREPSRIAMVSVEEASTEAATVVPAVAHAGDTEEFKRVKLVRHNPLRPASEAADSARGAWLAGTIELD